MSAEKQAILDKYIKLFHEYHDCLHCLNVGCNDRGKNDRRCCFQGNNLCVSWIENLAQEISALYIKETGQQATNTTKVAICPNCGNPLGSMATCTVCIAHSRAN